MKNYALIAVAFTCLLVTSCSNEVIEQQNIDKNSINVENTYSSKIGDSTNADTDPVKTNGKD